MTILNFLMLYRELWDFLIALRIARQVIVRCVKVPRESLSITKSESEPFNSMSSPWVQDYSYKYRWTASHIANKKKRTPLRINNHRLALSSTAEPLLCLWVQNLTKILRSALSELVYNCIVDNRCYVLHCVRIIHPQILEASKLKL